MRSRVALWNLLIFTNGWSCGIVGTSIWGSFYPECIPDRGPHPGGAPSRIRSQQLDEWKHYLVQQCGLP
jgi:hypothetical protein